MSAARARAIRADTTPLRVDAIGICRYLPASGLALYRRLLQA